MWHILNIHPFSFVPELHTLYFLIKNWHPFANTDIKKTPNCRFHLQALFVSGSKQKKQSPVKDFFCRKAGIFSRLHLCFLGKKEAFTPKEVSIFRKCLLLFWISLYVLADYIYCNDNRVARATDFFLLAFLRSPFTKYQKSRQNSSKKRFRNRKVILPFHLPPLWMKQNQKRKRIFACKPFLWTLSDCGPKKRDIEKSYYQFDTLINWQSLPS